MKTCRGEIGAVPLRVNPESETALVEMNKILEQAIESLPEQYRTVVMMRDVEEMTTAETAECLSLTEDNVKIRLHRAHGMLRKELYQSARISEANAFPFHAPRCNRIVTNVFARLAALEHRKVVRVSKRGVPTLKRPNNSSGKSPTFTALCQIDRARSITGT